MSVTLSGHFSVDHGVVLGDWNSSVTTNVEKRVVM